MLRPPQVVTLALGLLLGIGCRRAAQADGEREMVYRAAPTLTVRVVNRSQLDATIYLVHDGARDRLGTVTAGSIASFEVRAHALATGAFLLLADPVGSLRTTSSEALHASQGSQFTWTLEANFAQGSVLVRE